MKKIHKYLYKKLIAAGFAFSIFMFFIFIMISFDLYELSDTLKNPWLWSVFYPYAIIISMIMDGLSRTKFLVADKPKYMTLIGYQFFGFIPFVFIFPSIPFILIAGTVGILCASIFYTGHFIIANYKKISFVFAYMIPGLLIMAMLTDFTLKTDWQVAKTDTSYQVEFDYFNGHHKIPIELQQGDRLTYQVEVHTRSGGGWGDYVEGPRGASVPITLVESNDKTIPDKLQFSTSEGGTYNIVITGSRLSGSILVEWTISDA